MAITPGSRIGAYEVTAQLGEGGMGVVLRGKDTKLLRDVALKVLPDDLAGDPDRISRLQREAQLLASLNHPNIAQIYGLEQQGNTSCIVMELVEGETLFEKLKNGPIPVEEAIEIAKQIADALAAAHERGIIHRDLKPANIKITPNGTVKVLDFGLAKALTKSGPDTQLSTMPTKVSGSVAGMVVGTAAYMSPEQARGKEVDSRTDIWAFGCVLYEMLTARQAFEGETATDMIARIVSGQHDMNLLPANTLSSIRLLLEATLNKSVTQRLQHIGDIRLFLDPKFFPTTPVASAAAPEAESKARRGKLLSGVLAAALVIALIPAVLYFRPFPPPNVSKMYLEVGLPGVLGAPVVSPDGQRLAYLGQAPGENRAIWIRSVAGDNTQKLSGTDNANGAMMWSPDNRYLAFVADGKLKKIDILGGGGPVVICDHAGQSRGASWNGQGVILFAKTPENTIFRVSDAGGEPKPFITLDSNKKQIVAAAPVFLPDGNHFVYVVVSSVPEEAGFFVGSLDSQPPKRFAPLPDRLNGVAYAAPGYLLLTKGPLLTAQKFDAAAFALEGLPMTLSEEVQAGSFSVSDTGLLFYRKGSTQAPNDQLTWYDPRG